ncbi:MAG: hypothetical protein AAF208_14665 [Cyanobacteria bacterium P01_A01_bin.45]
MELEMVLNEFSLKTPVSDISTARQLMSELIDALRQATASGVQRILRTSDEIISLQLANNYLISRWLDDPEVDREERRFFNAFITKAPFWTDILEEPKNKFDLPEIQYQGELLTGFELVLVHDELVNHEVAHDNSKMHYPEHPLAKIAGKFEGDFWESTLENIQDLRKLEKQEMNKILDNQ